MCSAEGWGSERRRGHEAVAEPLQLVVLSAAAADRELGAQEAALRVERRVDDKLFTGSTEQGMNREGANSEGVGLTLTLAMSPALRLAGWHDVEKTLVEMLTLSLAMSLAMRLDLRLAMRLAMSLALAMRLAMSLAMRLAMRLSPYAAPVGTTMWRRRR